MLGSWAIKSRKFRKLEFPLTHPEYYEEMGIKPPKGVILYGPPGTGMYALGSTFWTLS